jgi:hypothetical protein
MCVLANDMSHRTVARDKIILYVYSVLGPHNRPWVESCRGCV